MKTAKELKKAIEADIKKILSKPGPIQFIDRYTIDYIHSYGQDSPFFESLRNKKLLGNYCQTCQYAYATPKTSCMYCGERTEWQELPATAKIHAFTVCCEGSEKFILKVPYALAVLEFASRNTLFLSQLKNFDLRNPSIDWIGMEVKAVFAKTLRNKKHVPTILDVWFEPRF